MDHRVEDEERAPEIWKGHNVDQNATWRRGRRSRSTVDPLVEG